MVGLAKVKNGAGAEVRQGKLEADFDTCNR
jgi:hypothetical protein